MRLSVIKRNFVLLLLSGSFTLNVYILLSLPSNRNDAVHPKDADLTHLRRDSLEAWHLQVPRRRFNKSNYTSGSLGADVAGGGAGAGAGGVERAVLDGRLGRGQPVGGLRNGSKTLGTRNDREEETGGKREEYQLRQEGVRQGPEPVRGGGALDNGGAAVGGQLVHRGHDERFRVPNGNVPAVREDPSQRLQPAGRQRLEEVDGEMKNRRASSPPVRRNFTDPQVDAFLRMLEEEDLLDVLPGQSLQQENYWGFLKRQRLRRKSGIQLPGLKSRRSRTNWDRFYKQIRQHFLYDPDSSVVQNLLDDLTHRQIVDVEQKEGGTQIKLIITFDNGGLALFKPMRFSRQTETLPDHFYFTDFERHIAEIAAFHLDRVLGYNRVPPVAGRLLNVSREIKQLADSKLARTFFVSPAGNLCFHGTCSYYCDSGHPVCGHPDQLEGSLMAFLPPDALADRASWRNPWKRSYSKRRKAYWETQDDLCEKIQVRAPYNKGRRLLDIVDMSILDFLMGNLDRHHYETFESFGNNTFLLHLDNGRGFGKQHEDDLTCLAPMLQCCMIRLSTLQRLARLYGGAYPLSVIMAVSLSSDQVSPVLIEGHLQALDRRLLKVLRAVNKCVQEGRALHQVVVDDGVY